MQKFRFAPLRFLKTHHFLQSFAHVCFKKFDRWGGLRFLNVPPPLMLLSPSAPLFLISSFFSLISFFFFLLPFPPDYDPKKSFALRATFFFLLSYFFFLLSSFFFRLSSFFFLFSSSSPPDYDPKKSFALRATKSSKFLLQFHYVLIDFGPAPPMVHPKLKKLTIWPKSRGGKFLIAFFNFFLALFSPSIS